MADEIILEHCNNINEHLISKVQVRYLLIFFISLPKRARSLLSHIFVKDF